MLGIFLDSETNGLNPQKHKVIELAFKLLDVNSGELKEEFQSIIFQPFEAWEKSDKESLSVNGFSWEEVKQGAPIFQVSEQVLSIFEKHEITRGKAVFICQNPSFDRVFFSQIISSDIQETLKWPYYWLDLASMYWSLSILEGKKDPKHFPWETGFSKDRIASTYHLPSEAKPHRAMNGVNHLLLCYEAVVGFPNAQVK